MGADVRVRVLGPVTVVGAPPLQGRDRRVLGALVVEAGRVCPADRLAEALYGSDPPATWRKVMHGSVGRLRQVLGAQAIATVDGGYRLELGDDQIDVRRFERLVAEGERLAAVGEPERAALRLGEALELVVAEPFADLDGWEPGVAAAARAAELVRRAEEQLVAAWLAAVGTRRRCGPRPTRWSGSRCGSSAGRPWRWPSPGRAPRRGVAHDPAGAPGVGRRVGVGSRPGAGRVGTGDPRPGSASDRPGAGRGLVGRGLPVSRTGRLRPRRRRLVLRA